MPAVAGWAWDQEFGFEKVTSFTRVNERQREGARYVYTISKDMQSRSNSSDMGYLDSGLWVNIMQLTAGYHLVRRTTRA